MRTPPALLVVVVAALACAVAVLMFGRTGEPIAPPASTERASPPGADDHAPTTTPPSAEPRQPRPQFGTRAAAPREFPMDGSTLQDPALRQLYRTLLQATTAPPTGTSALDRATNERARLEAAACVSLIREGRLWHCGATPAPPRPTNTADAVWHLTHCGDLQVVFELTRQEFPELFAKMDAERAELEAWNEANGNLGR
jgi:hypothetical protein